MTNNEKVEDFVPIVPSVPKKLNRVGCMDLIELADELGMKLIKVSQTDGGEYHSACPYPGCGGKDRFVVWPNKKYKNSLGGYWCRVCNKRGDAIQFCRDLLGLKYVEACKKLKIAYTYSSSHQVHDLTKINHAFNVAIPPNTTWQAKASSFVDWCHNHLMTNHNALAQVLNRGFSLASIQHFKIGHNPANIYRLREDWGLDMQIGKNRIALKICLNAGLVIPTFNNDRRVIKIKIRRSENDIKKDINAGRASRKYIEIKGSQQCPAIYGNADLPAAIILESEFDALLIQQFCSDLVFCIALGGAQKKPDLQTHNLLRNTPTILFALDFDDAGKNAYYFWKSTYAHLKAWPIPIEKSPGDAFLAGVDLREWIEQGLNYKATLLKNEAWLSPKNH